MPRGMLAYLVLLGLAVLPGLLARLPPGQTGALAELADGVLDRKARLSALAIVLRGGRDPGATPGQRLAGACAAIELADRGGFLQIWSQVEPAGIELALVGRNTFGQAHLRELVLGLRAEAAAELDSARAHFARAALAARFAGAALAVRLAEQGLQRLPR